MYRKQLNLVIDQIIHVNSANTVEPEIINDYKNLNDKCDKIIARIKNRKSQQETKINDRKNY